MKKNRWAPCEEKKCSFCCDPVGLTARYAPNVDNIKDTTGRSIRKYTGMRPSKDHPDTVKIWLYECLLFDTSTGKCKNYEQRPNICRNTSCFDPTCKKSVDKQHKEFKKI